MTSDRSAEAPAPDVTSSGDAQATLHVPQELLKHGGDAHPTDRRAASAPTVQPLLLQSFVAQDVSQLLDDIEETASTDGPSAHVAQSLMTQI